MILLAFAAAAMLLFYYFVLRCAAFLLTESGMGWCRPVLPAALNAAATLASYLAGLSLSAFCILCLPVLAAELALLLRARPLRALFAGGIVMIHCSSSYMICSSLFAALWGLTPYAVYQDAGLYGLNIGAVCIVGLLALLAAWRLLPVRDVRNLSDSVMYTGMVSAISVFMVLYTSVDLLVLASEEVYPNVLVSSISTAVLTMMTLYILLFYSISSSRLMVYKRKSDALEQARKKNLQYQERLKAAMRKDGLTSCYNRGFIMELLQDLLDRGVWGFMVLFLDLNGLKYVNDTFGHDMGDKYILGVSAAVQRAVRAEDYVARIGGDEFLAVLTDVGETDADRIIRRIRCNIETLNGLQTPYRAAASIGGVYVDETLGKAGLSQIIEAADRKMLLEKEAYYHERRQ